MLDRVDTALVRILQRNGRATYQELAERVGMSRTAVRVRVRNLLDSNTIRIVAVLHPGVTGCTTLGHVSLGLHGPAQPVATHLAHRPAVAFLAHSGGRFPLVTQLRVHGEAELAAELDELRGLSGVRAVEVFRARTVVKEAHGDLREWRCVPVDPLDWRLIERLQRNGRVSYATLARQVGLSQAATRSRVVRLLAAGVLRIVALVGDTAPGSRQHLGFGLNCAGDTDRVATRLAAVSGVVFLSCGFGRYDIVGHIVTGHFGALLSTLEEIRALTGVVDVESWQHLAVLKEDPGSGVDAAIPCETSHTAR